MVGVDAPQRRTTFTSLIALTIAMRCALCSLKRGEVGPAGFGSTIRAPALVASSERLTSLAFACDDTMMIGRRHLADDPHRSLEPVELGHLNVHGDQIGAKPLRHLDRFESVARLADDRDVGIARQHLDDQLPRGG